MKADKRKHLLTCHYEGSARPGPSYVPRNAWLLPAQREDKKKAEKRQGFFLFASSQVDLIDGPPDFIAIFELLEMPPSCVCVCVSTHTHPHTHGSGPRPSLISSSWANPTAVSTLRRGRAGASVCRVSVRLWPGEGARSAPGARPAGSRGIRRQRAARTPALRRCAVRGQTSGPGPDAGDSRAGTAGPPGPPVLPARGKELARAGAPGGRRGEVPRGCLPAASLRGARSPPPRGAGR